MDVSLDLREVLRLHQLWIGGNPAGHRAVMVGADLTGADLTNADLTNADLYGAHRSGHRTTASTA